MNSKENTSAENVKQDTDVPGPQELIPFSPKDPEVFKTVHHIERFNKTGQSKDTLIAMLVIFENEKSESLDKVKRLEKELNSERTRREATDTNYAVLQERLGSPSILMAGLLTFISTVLLTATQPLPTSNRGLIIFGCAIMAGLVSVIFSAIFYFGKPRENNND